MEGYTLTMSILATPTEAPKPKTKDVTIIATFYAAILTVMAVAQLYSFDTFTEHMASLGLPGGIAMGYFLASFIVVAEVFALPFLLRMRISPAFRVFSMLLGWIVPVVWLKVSIWMVATYSDAVTVGFFGTVVDTMPGWWAVLVSGAFGILAAWSAWGMWPLKKRLKRTK